MAFLNFDIITGVLEQVADDYDLLARCSRINWEFNHAASRLLYSRVVLFQSAILTLRDRGLVPVSNDALHLICISSFSWTRIFEL